jgi:hypothetical protein
MDREATLNYRIESIDPFVRETPPGRLAVAIGKQPDPGATPQAPERPMRTTDPISQIRLMLGDRRGRRAFGCPGDRMSVRRLGQSCIGLRPAPSIPPTQRPGSTITTDRPVRLAATAAVIPPGVAA